MSTTLKHDIVLVDEDGVQVGTGAKMDVHRRGVLHRAFSVFLFNAAGETLLQQRAHAKYHSGGLWTNTCCGHPRPGENTTRAAERRLREELGIEAQLIEAFRFVYRAELDHGLTEHELDHVYVGRFDGQPSPNRDEVEDWRWVAPVELERDVSRRPERYTAWFVLCYRRGLDAAKLVLAGNDAP